MSESDVLSRAAKALREAHTGERAGSGFTRARIMNTLHIERRRRILRWVVVSPLVSVLLVGSAWAQSTGKWPVIWRAVAAVFSAVPETSEPGSRAPERRRQANELATPAPTPAELEPAPAPPATEPAPAVAPPAPAPPQTLVPALERPKPRARAGQGPAPRVAPRSVQRAPKAKPVQPAPAPAAARELAAFREAHDLHFRDRAREAIAAYAAYLRDYPSGRFVPEARYNSALDHIKLGERDAAREALEPFAAGDYAGYRQKEAQELLKALR